MEGRAVPVSEGRLHVYGIPQRYVVVFLTFLCTFVCYVERVGFSLAYSHAANEIMLDQNTKAFVMSSFYYGYALSQVPGGWAAQRLGGRRVLLFSFILWSATCIMTPTTQGPIFGLIVARLLIGVAQGFIFPSIHTVLAVWIPPHERSRSVSLTTSGMYLGAAAAMLFLPRLIVTHGSGAVYKLVAAMGVMWAIVWMQYSTDPPGMDPHGSSAVLLKSISQGSLERLEAAEIGRLENGGEEPAGGERGGGVGARWSSEGEGKGKGASSKGGGGGGGSKRGAWEKSEERRRSKKKGGAESKGQIPWKQLCLSLPVWAIIVNNFTFHYALYVLMNWLPTYFDLYLQASLSSVGWAKMLPYVVMFVFSNVGGVFADHLITRHIASVTRTRKLINTVGFFASAFAFVVMPTWRSVTGAVVSSSIALGSCAFARAGFAVNHMDIAPRYAGIVMGLSNTAGTLAGVVGVTVTGAILQSSGKGDVADEASWIMVFSTPAVLCILSAAVFSAFATGERIFD